MSEVKSLSEIDSVIESKLRDNLQWSMLFAIFNYISSESQDKDRATPAIPSKFAKQFFKNWKKFACEHVIKKDLETIHSILNSPKNIFYSVLQDSSETIESTEIYQEKYNNTLKKIEEFYFKNLSSSENNNE